MLLRTQEPRVPNAVLCNPGFLRSQENEEKIKPGYVYLMASRRNGTLYLGVTSDLPARAYQHRNRMIDGFSREHGCTLLVWYVASDDIQAARQRELQMKKWKRTWKIDLIERDNPQWKDLYETLF